MNFQIHLKRLECNIIEYVLTLTFNQSQNQMTGIEEIKSSSNYSGISIGNLYPGYNYSISLTPKTNKGLLISSPTYSFTPLITSNLLFFINLYKHIIYRIFLWFKISHHATQIYFARNIDFFDITV